MKTYEEYLDLLKVAQMDANARAEVSRLIMTMGKDDALAPDSPFRFALADWLRKQELC